MAESPRPRILYIEDDPGLGTLLQQRLEREGYEVSLAPDSLSGMILHEKTPFDALLIDNSLPGMTGLEVIRKLAPTDTSPPVIMVTGTGDEETAVEAMKLGASDYLVKDVAGVYLRLLATVIKEAIFKRRLTRERNEVVKALVQSEHRLKDNLSVFRAIESRRWVVRSGNTGISCFIDPNGKIVSELGLDRRGVLSGQIRPRETLTFHTQFGDGFAWLCGLIALAGLRMLKKKPFKI